MIIYIWSLLNISWKWLLSAFDGGIEEVGIIMKEILIFRY
jgi:hypothetical protein